MGNVFAKIEVAYLTQKVSFYFFLFAKLCKDVKYNVYKEEVVLAELPLEVITEVLMWLPAKSLLRFRCVSKSFCAIIDSKHFINSHLNRSMQDTSHLKLIFPTSNQIVTNYNSAKLDVSDFDSIGRVYELEVFGYCNGVFLVLLSKRRPAIWNPSTHQLRIIPCFPGHETYHDIRMGLGYDSSRDDYKVVAIYTCSYTFRPVTVEYQAWAFGLRSNSWRRIHSDFLSAVYAYSCDSHFGYFVHGALHWWFGNAISFHDLVAFDMAKETFSILPQPPYNRIEATLPNVNVLDKCLCIGYVTYLIEDEALLYVRKKDEEGFTWSLLYSVTRDRLPRFLKVPNFFHLEVLGYSKNGDKIMLDLGLTFMVLYDLKDKSFQPAGITRPTVRQYLCYTRSLVESLVSIRNIV